VKRSQALAPAVWLTLSLQAACASRSVPPVTAPCKISVGQGGQVDLAGLPALSADGARVAVPERCDGRRGPPCLAIVLFSVDGKVQQRVEVARQSVSEAQIRLVNQLLAAGRFVPMTSLELPFSASDFNLMTLHVSGVVIHYGGGSLLVDRDDHRLATVDLATSGDCTGPWIRSLFLDDKTHTLAAEFEYDGTGCSDPPPSWRVLRFP
jgi:hypothetical protein